MHYVPGSRVENLDRNNLPWDIYTTLRTLLQECRTRHNLQDPDIEAIQKPAANEARRILGI